MCVDFNNLNKHFPKYLFLLPRIDQIVNSATGCEILCFIGAFSGYNQIMMKMDDEENTAFITTYG
jgi:hypothetical protein